MPPGICYSVGPELIEGPGLEGYDELHLGLSTSPRAPDPFYDAIWATFR